MHATTEGNKDNRSEGVRNRFIEVKPVSNVSKAECPSALGKSKGNHTKANQEKTIYNTNEAATPKKLWPPPPPPPPPGFSDFLVSLDCSLVSRYTETEAGSYNLFLLTYGPVSVFFSFSPIFFALAACKRSGGEKKRPLHPIPQNGRSHTPFKAAQRHTVHQTKNQKKG